MAALALTPSHALSLAPRGRTDREPPTSELLRDGAPTGVIVPGVVLERQYRVGDSYLLLTTEDVPYEEALHVVLLDDRLAVLDRLQLAHPLAAGALTDVESADRERLRFSFFGGDVWELTILPAPRRLSRDEAPTGVSGRLRRLLSRRRLAIRRLR